MGFFSGLRSALTSPTTMLTGGAFLPQTLAGGRYSPENMLRGGGLFGKKGGVGDNTQVAPAAQAVPAAPPAPPPRWDDFMRTPQYQQWAAQRQSQRQGQGYQPFQGGMPSQFGGGISQMPPQRPQQGQQWQPGQQINPQMMQMMQMMGQQQQQQGMPQRFMPGTDMSGQMPASQQPGMMYAGDMPSFANRQPMQGGFQSQMQPQQMPQSPQMLAGGAMATPY